MSDKLIRLKLTIAYRGTNYHGWQSQNLSPARIAARGKPLPTVQVELERVLSTLLCHHVSTTGSSRTDTGVHAKGQVCHLDTSATTIPMRGLRNAVNARLPDDIRVRTVRRVADDFNAISWAVRKRYQYIIWNHAFSTPFNSDLAFHRWQKIDAGRMAEAAGRLVGTHDFTSFAKPGHGRATTIRTIHECSVERQGPMIVIGVTGSGFLWNMVRIIAGTLVDIGRGVFPPDDIPRMIAARDRLRSGQTAPAHGLYLQWIRFARPAADAAVPVEDETD
jgi:tRNA pseudouridine38-40 synthase